MANFNNVHVQQSVIFFLKLKKINILLTDVSLPVFTIYWCIMKNISDYFRINKNIHINTCTNKQNIFHKLPQLKFVM